uniref:Uncharacterized protein n=1 Tax=Pithovirus LCDPAC02 TaxID=2506601 RepID=A0A481YPC5_9VIRU|nr:MAG: hypothetical protein LCDPAC02_03010 [Pithovirus LCDPAC02]
MDHTYIEKLISVYNKSNEPDSFGCGGAFFYANYVLCTGKILCNNYKPIEMPFYCPHCVITKFDGSMNKEKVIDFIKLKLNHNGWIPIDLTWMQSHCFILCSINDQIYIVDSYEYTRPLSKRRFDLDRLQDFLEHPSQLKWNTLFECEIEEYDWDEDIDSWDEEPPYALIFMWNHKV